MQLGCWAWLDIIQVSAHPVTPSEGMTKSTGTLAVGCGGRVVGGSWKAPQHGLEDRARRAADLRRVRWRDQAVPRNAGGRDAAALGPAARAQQVDRLVGRVPALQRHLAAGLLLEG